MERGNVTTSQKMMCIICNKICYDYIDFHEGISINVPYCREHLNDIRKYDRIMTAHLRLIKAELKIPEEYGTETNKDIEEW